MLRAVIGWRRDLTRIALCLTAVAAASCGGGSCGLGIHDRVTLTPTSAGGVPCCGGFLFRDVALMGRGDSEFDLSNVAMPAQPGLIDAFLVPTSCAKLFDGAYPGAAPLCQVYSGPAAPGRVSSRVALNAGTYRLWLQAYTSNATTAPYFVDIDIWDHSCRNLIQ
jgi:hypothetical protein